MLPALGFSFFFLLLIGTPIAFALGISGAIGIMIQNPDFLRLVPQRLYAGVDSFPLMAIPFFVLAGELMGTSGILSRLVRLAEALVGHVRGGLAHVCITTGMIFAGVSGSAIADASALGSTLVPAMKKGGYSTPFSCAVVGSAALVAPIIPPSIPMIVYAFVVGQVSIGGLFLAGIVPGLAMGLGLMVVVYVIARRRSYPSRGRTSIRELWAAFVNAMWAMFMPIIILGGILGGIFTATEAGAVAVAYAVFVGLVITRELRWQHMRDALSRCVTVSAVVFLLIATSSIIAWLLTAALVPTTVANWMRGISTEPAVFLLLTMSMLLVLGCFLDNIAAMIMTAPILAPIAGQFGIDSLQFGTMFVLASVFGMMTPPVGAVLFTVSGVAKTPIEPVIRESLPLLAWILFVLGLVAFVPSISLAVPHFFGYGG